MEISAPKSMDTAEVSTFQGEVFAPDTGGRMQPQFTYERDDTLGDVRSLLRRPRFLQTFQPEDVDVEHALDWDFYKNNFQLGERFAGALGFRATTCFRLVLAASPQVGGLGRLYYDPARQTNSVLSTNRNSVYTSKPNYYTQLPGVEIDFAKSTAVDFKVRYTSYLEYMPLVTSAAETVQQMTLGMVRYEQYLPVGISPTTDPPRITIYTWLEDLEIIGARNPDLALTNFEAGTIEKTFNMTVPPKDLTGPAVGTLKRVTNTGYDSVVYEMVLTGQTSIGLTTIYGHFSKLPGGNVKGAVTYNGTGGTLTAPLISLVGPDSRILVEWEDPVGGILSLIAEFSDTLVVSQSGIAQLVEEDVERNGPLSGPLYAASKVAKVLGRIPMLSAISGPVSWATRVASNVVAAFGYSRPLQLEHNSRFWQSQNHYQNNADGPDTSFNMGLLQDNKVGIVSNMAGVGIDEMALEYVATKAAFLGYFKVGVTNFGLQSVVALCPTAMYSTPDIPPSSQIMNRPPIEWLDPTNVAFSAGLQVPLLLNDGVSIDTTPNFMLGSLFKYYRGGFKFRVKCNKTRFHAGRLALVYTPYTDISHKSRKLYVPENTEMDLYSQVTVWDLREDNEIEFECPYVYNKPYCEVGEPYGCFTIHVIDRLTAPENVDSFVEFAIEVEALKDIEYAFPTPGDYIVDPIVDYRVEQVGGFVRPESDAVVSQSGLVVDQGNNDDIEPDCACIGERVLSLKQIISRAEWWSLFPFLNIGTQDPVKLPTWFETPSLVGKFVPPLGSTSYIGSFKKSSRAIITNCYMFARGSTCYDVISYDQTPIVGNPASTGSTEVLSQRAETFITLVDETSPSNGLLGTGSVICEVGPFSHVKVPFYSQTKKVMVNPCLESINDNGVLAEFTSLDAQRFAKASLYGPNNCKFSIRAGDDAQLAYFLCSTPLVYAKQGPFNVPSLGNNSAIGGAVDAYQLVPRHQRVPPYN